MNRELIIGGVNLRESFLTGQDLEGYFMELLGGDARASLVGQRFTIEVTIPVISI